MADRLCVSALVRKAELGSSQPWIARASDGRTYVIKFAGAGPGTAALAAELVVNTVAASWGLPVPAAQPVWIERGLPRAGTDEFWDVLDASAGWNLAIELIDGARNVALAREELPPAVVDAMLAIDLVFVNFDRTTLSNNVLVGGDGRHWLIDHGSCVFARRLAAAPVFELPPQHILAARSWSPPTSRVPATDAAAMAALLEPVPDAWLPSLGLSREELCAGLAARITAFAQLPTQR